VTRALTPAEALSRATPGVHVLVVCQGALLAARALSQGKYQAAVLDGREACDGSTLRGSSRRYRGKYRRSLTAFLGRLRKHNVAYDIVAPRLLVIGAYVIEDTSEL
jgi:hypothetical protein